MEPTKTGRRAEEGKLVGLDNVAYGEEIAPGVAREGNKAHVVGTEKKA